MQRELVQRAHAANSAATLREKRAHFDMVRCGIAVIRDGPFGRDPLPQRLEPALELSSYLAEVKACAPGQSAGYGRRFVAARDDLLGVLPIGYGDGWRRALSDNADVLIAAERRPIVGTVSMDNLTVDLGDAPDAHTLRGSEAVLIGARDEQRITAEELARRMDTINYEVTCGLTPGTTGLPPRRDRQRAWGSPQRAGGELRRAAGADGASADERRGARGGAGRPCRPDAHGWWAGRCAIACSDARWPIST